MVVACRERAHVAEPVEGDSVLRRAEADGGRIARDLALRHVVRRLRADEEAVAAEDGVCSEGGALSVVRQKRQSEVSLWDARRITGQTLKRSRKARLWRPGCL